MPTTPAPARRKNPRPDQRRSAPDVTEGRLLISDLLQIVEQDLDPKEVKAIYQAYLFGAEAHEGQVRHSGEAYIFHPLSVARILADMRLDSHSIIAALLHDVIEDTPTAKKELVAQFGKDVAQLVDGVSKIDQIEFDSPEHAEAENFRKMLLAMSKDIRVILIKLADRIHNMRTLDALRVDRRKRISQQTLDIFAPIANRLGMYAWTQELEDLSFCNLYPKRYDAIYKELGKRRGNRRKIIEKTKKNIAEEVEQAGIEATVVGREKNIYSVYRKMQKRRVPLVEMGDIFAIRIIVRSADDCYRVLGLMHNLYKPVPGKFKDYIAIPKANGYQSLHTLLFGTFGQSIEVQIRTEDMHRVAETGVASHWRYKTGKEKSGPQMPTHSWLVDLLDTQQAGDPSDFLEHLKTDLFPDEVYVFTPQGDIKKLPKGASALDFAYAVHSDIGNHCIGARINNESVPLHQELGNGNHVEILTARSAVPTPLWLNYAVTGKARAAIRNFLKNQQEGDAVKLGRQLLDRALKSEGLKTRLRTDQKIELLKRIGREDWNELLGDIGTGRRLPKIVAKQLLPGSSNNRASTTAEPLPIKGIEGMSISYARCCRPIPGDTIVGLFSHGRGIVIHKASSMNNKTCRNVDKQGKRPDNWIEVEWAEDIKTTFEADIRLEVVNRRGVFATLASVIAEEDSNINHVLVTARDDRNSAIRFTIEVRDRKHLAQIIRRLRARRSVIRVSRTRG